MRNKRELYNIEKYAKNLLLTMASSMQPRAINSVEMHLPVTGKYTLKRGVTKMPQGMQISHGRIYNNSLFSLYCYAPHSLVSAKMYEFLPLLTRFFYEAVQKETSRKIKYINIVR